MIEREIEEISSENEADTSSLTASEKLLQSAYGSRGEQLVASVQPAVNELLSAGIPINPATRDANRRAMEQQDLGRHAIPITPENRERLRLAD